MLLPNRRGVLLGGTSFLAASAMPASAAKKNDSEIDPFKARVIRVAKDTPAGHIYVYPDKFALYYTLDNGRAIYYPVGVAQRHLWEPGTYVIRAKKEWPSWTPTEEMMERNPKYEEWKDGMPGGPGNPLGARALYLFHLNGGDSFLRIHGTNSPRTIRTRVSNGCARLVNPYVIDLYNRVPKGTQVHLHPMSA